MGASVRIAVCIGIILTFCVITTADARPVEEIRESYALVSERDILTGFPFEVYDNLSLSGDLVAIERSDQNLQSHYTGNLVIEENLGRISVVGDLTVDGCLLVMPGSQVKVSGDLLVRNVLKTYSDMEIEGAIVTNESLQMLRASVVAESIEAGGRVVLAQSSLTCNSVKAMSMIGQGVIHASGNLAVKNNLTLIGALHIGGDLMAGECQVSMLESDANVILRNSLFVTSEAMFCKGDLHIGENLSLAREAYIAGDLEVGGSILAGFAPNPLDSEFERHATVYCRQFIRGYIFKGKVVEKAN